MWFKGVLVLSYTALLVTPTNAIFQHKDEVLGRRESLTARRYHRLNRRQDPWSNQTTVPEVPETQEPEPVVPETPAPVVITSSSDQPLSTSAPLDEIPSTSEDLTTTEIPTATESSLVDTTSVSTAANVEVPASEPSSSPTSTSSQAITTDSTSDVLPSITEAATSDVVPSTTEVATSDVVPSTTEVATSDVVPSTTEAATSDVTSSSQKATTDVTSSDVTSNAESSAVPTSEPISSAADPTTGSGTSEATLSPTASTTLTKVSETSVSEAPSSTEATTVDISSEVPQSTAEESVIVEPTETPTSVHSRTLHSQPKTTTKPTVIDESTSSIAPTVSPTDTAGTSGNIETPVASETPTPAEKTATQSATLSKETTESKSEIPTSSRTQSEATETSETEVPITTGSGTTITSDVGSTTDGPATTAAPILPGILPVSSIISDVENGPSIIGSIVSSVASELEAIPTKINSAISSLTSDIEAIPTMISSAISSFEVLTSAKPVEPTIPASETASDISASFIESSAPTPTGDGISLPGVSGTGATPVPSAVPTDAPKAPTDDSDSTSIEATPTASEPMTTAADPTSADVSEATTTSEVPSSSVEMPSFSMLDPSAVPTSASSAPSDLAPSEIPVSETEVSPTPTDVPTTSVGETSAIETPVPGTSGTGELPVTDLTSATSDAHVPTLVPTSEIAATTSGTLSDVPNPTLVPTSGLGVSMTSGTAVLTGITTSASIAHPTDPAISSGTVTSAIKVDNLESQVPIDAPIPTSESTTNPETSTSNGEPSPVPSSTEALATATEVSSQAPSSTSQANDESTFETAVPSQDSTDSPADEIPTETSVQLGPPPTVPTGWNSDPAASPSASSTEAPLGDSSGEDKPPPLSKSQTAGIAVGGTTCLLVALVAALFLARRYHSNASDKRHSTGDVYPEMAYIYDPPTGGNNNHDAEAGGALPAVSSGATGATGAGGAGSAGGALARSLSNKSTRGPAMEGAAAGGLARSLSKASSHRHSIGPVYGARENASSPSFLPRESRYSTGSYLSTGPWDPSLALNAAAAASSVSLNQYKDEVAQNPFRDPEEPKPVATPSPMGGTVNGPLINPYAFNAFNNASPDTRGYPPMAPYGPAKRNSSPVRHRASERQSDPFADPFEHDLILNVAPHASTDSSIVLGPPTPRSVAPTRGPSPNPYEFRPPPAPFTKHFPGRNSDCDSLIPEPLVPSGRNTPEGRRSPAPRGFPGNQQGPAQPPVAHISPKPPQDGNTWNNNTLDHPGDVPAPLFPKKPLPLRRQPTLAGPGQTLLASTGLPLTIKRKPMGDDSISGVLDVPRNQHLSPSPTPTHADFSDDPVVQRKRSGEMMFADPQLLGRQF